MADMLVTRRMGLLGCDRIQCVRDHTLNVLHAVRFKRMHQLLLLHLVEPAAKVTRVQIPVLRYVLVLWLVTIVAASDKGVRCMIWVNGQVAIGIIALVGVSASIRSRKIQWCVH